MRGCALRKVVRNLAHKRERERERGLFKRETEHLYERPPIHGIGRDPLARE